MQQFDFKNVKLDTESLPIVQKTTSGWCWCDYWGAFKVRWSVGRNSYRIKPGLYKLGNANPDSPVMVSANYKLSFDILRRSLAGFDAWILVLDTKGVNVWCAAGKGTFGTSELVKRIEDSELSRHVNHKKLIVPQLGAPGVSAHQVQKASGFKVIFGPVKASDIPSFLNQSFQCSEQMRTVTFPAIERLKLAPVEISNSLKYLIAILLVFIAISGLTINGYSFDLLRSKGIEAVLIIVGAYLSGSFIAPVLLPWLPSRMFALKGMIAGALAFGLLYFVGVGYEFWVQSLGWLFFATAISSFLTMNFTGSSTYTSLSGVMKEMKIFVPVQLVLAIGGTALIVISKILWA